MNNAIIIKHAGSTTEQVVGSLVGNSLEMFGKLWPVESGLAYAKRIGLAIMWIA